MPSPPTYNNGVSANLTVALEILSFDTPYKILTFNTISQ